MWLTSLPSRERGLKVRIEKVHESFPATIRPSSRNNRYPRVGHEVWDKALDFALLHLLFYDQRVVELHDYRCLPKQSNRERWAKIVDHIDSFAIHSKKSASENHRNSGDQFGEIASSAPSRESQTGDR